MPFDPQLMVAEETTPGTAVTPTRGFEYDKCAIKQDIDRIEKTGLRPNRKIVAKSGRVPGKAGVGGDIEMAVMQKGMALLFKHALGAVATTTPTGGTTTRDHKCTVGTLDGKSLTVQEGKPFVGGSVQPFTWAGCKIDKWELSGGLDDPLTLKLTMDGMSETTATGLATASYPSSLLSFPYTAGAITVAGSSFDVKDFSLAGDNNLAKDRFFIRSTTPAAKKEQLEGGGLREYTGSLSAEFTSLTAYNLFLSGASAALTVTYGGSTWPGASTMLIEGSLYYTITVTLPDIQFDGETPDTDGFQIIDQPLPFKVVDGVNADGPVIITIRNSDTTP